MCAVISAVIIVVLAYWLYWLFFTVRRWFFF